MLVDLITARLVLGMYRNRNLWFGSHPIFFRYCFVEIYFWLSTVQVHSSFKWKIWICICVSSSFKLPAYFILVSLIKSRFFIAKLPKNADSQISIALHSFFPVQHWMANGKHRFLNNFVFTFLCLFETNQSSVITCMIRHFSNNTVKSTLLRINQTSGAIKLTHDLRRGILFSNFVSLCRLQIIVYFSQNLNKGGISAEAGRTNVTLKLKV